MIRKLLLLFIFISSCTIVSAHNIDYGKIILHKWTLPSHGETIEGNFLLYKNGNIFIERADGSIIQFPYSKLSDNDKIYADARIDRIAIINQQDFHQSPVNDNAPYYTFRFLIVLVLLGIFSVYIITLKNRLKVKYLIVILVFGVAIVFVGFTNQNLRIAQTTTDPLTMDSAFAPFKPAINTFWDSIYFHVESNGIPDHSMMTGITAWQQQVPLPQCYTGNNAWSIPLNPVLAATPVPVNQQHFLRGAVAIAANGIPIFNPYTNTGADAYLTGQLDNWGGHSGRADDYHYHIAPMVLYNTIAANMPVAYALDGFAVYGNEEPDGSSVAPLDTNHGHFFTNGVYHYHASPAAPYMIGNMVGQVTEDTTLQIVPQAHATPVRPSLTPLTGAVITGFQPNVNGNGYVLEYTLSGQTYYVDYNWTTQGLYTYNFIAPGGTTTQSYNGNAPCTLITYAEAGQVESRISIYPNPQSENVILNLSIPSGIRADRLDLYSSEGKKVFEKISPGSQVSVGNLPAGIYLISINVEGKAVVRKIMVR